MEIWDVYRGAWLIGGGVAYREGYPIVTPIATVTTSVDREGGVAYRRGRGL